MFKIGEKVVCIDDSKGKITGELFPFKKGSILTVTDLCNCGCRGLNLNGLGRVLPSDRFISLNDNFAEDVLSTVSKEVDEIIGIIEKGLQEK